MGEYQQVHVYFCLFVRKSVSVCCSTRFYPLFKKHVLYSNINEHVYSTVLSREVSAWKIAKNETRWAIFKKDIGSWCLIKPLCGIFFDGFRLSKSASHIGSSPWISKQFMPHYIYIYITCITIATHIFLLYYTYVYIHMLYYTIISYYVYIYTNIYICI